MEVVVILTAVIALCLCLGVSLEYIMLGIMALLVMVLLCIVGFFIYCLFDLMGAKKKYAQFSKIALYSQHSYKTAFYTIGDSEYPNALPCEIIFKRRLYKPDKTVCVWLTRKNIVYDKNAVITVLFGILAGGCSAAYTIGYLYEFFTF